MPGWKSEFDIRNLWYSSKTVFIGLLIYAELKARDVIFKIDSSFLIRISTHEKQVYELTLYWELNHERRRADGNKWR